MDFLHKILESQDRVYVRLMYDHVPGLWAVRTILTKEKIAQIEKDVSVIAIRVSYEGGGTADYYKGQSSS